MYFYGILHLPTSLSDNLPHTSS